MTLSLPHQWLDELSGDPKDPVTVEQMRELLNRLQENQQRIAKQFPISDENLAVGDVWGIVNADGTTLTGSDNFASVKNATGDYTISFNPDFADVPAVVAMVGSTSGVLHIKVWGGVNVTAAAVRLNVYNATPADADAQFHFIARGPR